MSEIMLEQIRKVCPPRRLRYMYMVDVEEWTHKTLKKLGYKESKTIKKAIDKTWANSDRDDFLYKFIYQVWRNDS